MPPPSAIALLAVGIGCMVLGLLGMTYASQLACVIDAWLARWWDNHGKS